ncbi:MAG: sigma-70 family RNA polymerase sigma factor [Planctomycetales bacterium]
MKPQRNRFAGDSEGDLVERSFEEFFRIEYPRLLKTMVLMTGSSSDGEDLAQEAMVRVFERWDRIAGTRSPAGYAYKTAFNLNRKTARRRRVSDRILPLLLRDVSAPNGHDATELRLVIAKMPRPLKEALIVVDWLGYTSEEASRILGIRPAGVRSRLHRARPMLVHTLGED